MAITMIKKIKLDGAPCRKCAEVEERLRTSGMLSRIDRIVIADERDATSEGMRLASELGVDAAPFFIVDDAGNRTIYTSYVKLLQEVLESQPSDEEEAQEIMARTDDLDFL